MDSFVHSSLSTIKLHYSKNMYFILNVSDESQFAVCELLNVAFIL